METIVLQEILNAGAAACGVVSYRRAAEKMDAESRARAENQNPGLQSLICAVYPYEGPGKPGNIALYARGEDYHAAAGRRLKAAADVLSVRYPKQYFHAYADVSPFPEVYAATCAGVGVIGRNGLLITPRGSYVVIGILATDLPSAGPATEPASCAACGACQRACPTGALSAGGVDPEKCLSAVTQRRGALTPEEEAAVRRGGLIWGCDRCQTCCPMNGNPWPPLPELKASLFSLSEADTALGDKRFRERFRDYAFTWRGVQPLRRNLALLSAAEAAAGEHKGEE